MKKSILMLGLGLIALTSCSESEVLDAVDDSKDAAPIGFTTWVGKQTRAEVKDNDVEALKGSSNGSDKGFYLMGGYKDASNNFVQLFDGSAKSSVRYNSDGTTGSWQYSPVYFWEKDCKYKFAAYAPVLTGMTSETPSYSYDDNAITIKDFVADGQTDLIVSTSCSGTNFLDANTYRKNGDANIPIPMQFKHALAKVCFTFENGWTNAVDVKISNIKLANVKTKGTLVTRDNMISSGVLLDAWSTNTETTSETTVGLVGNDYVDNTEWSSNITGQKYHFENFLIPQTLVKDPAASPQTTDIALTFTVTITYSGSSGGPNISGDGKNTKEITANIPVNAVTEWHPGYLYTYTIKITGDTFGLSPIKFTLSNVQNWDNPNESNVIWDVKSPAYE